MMRSDRKPPLALRSPVRLRPRRCVQSNINNLQNSSVSVTKSHQPKRSEENELRPEYQTISSELKELSKMVEDNLWGSNTKNKSANAHPLFQRGKFYDEYSARRNERLKRKRGESEIEKTTPCKQYLESAKRSTEVEKFESGRKMTTPLMERGQMATTTTTTATTTTTTAATTQRYSLRSSCKENKKPPLAMSFERPSMEKKTTVRRSARKGY